jgi:hypothetical protein
MGYRVGMPSQSSSSPSGKRTVCKALTTSGSRCKATAVPGLTVCVRHGGATAASARKSKRSVVEATAAVLWGIDSGTGSLSVEEELTKLFRNKLADVTALRLKISADEIHSHIGRLHETTVEVEYDITGTVQSKEGTQITKSRRAGTSVWVQELHKAEAELLAIARLLHEITGSTDAVDTKRIRIQTAREAARILKAFPGLSVDDVAAEVSKRAS